MLQAAGVAFATVFLAELGDKSQLLAFSLAARYRRGVLLAAVLITATLTVGVSAFVGNVAGDLLPRRALGIGAGLLFLVFALVTWRAPAADDVHAVPGSVRQGGLLTAVLALTVAELGDKTMVATLTLAATTSAMGVWLGGSLGMASAGALAVLLGSTLWRRLDPRAVRHLSAGLFAVVGVVLLVDAVR